MITALVLFLANAATLEVGTAKAYSRIEDALAVAKEGDTIKVFPSINGYNQVALRVTKPQIHLVAASGRVVLDGTGFEYSGSGPIPRAIIQFEPGGSGGSIQGFTLRGAHNASFNGAGVRINGAADVSVTDCEITANDMGIMSGGTTASNQLIEHCHIHHNGTDKEPGQNHNLYLGGDSVVIQRCEIDHALTGHDLKSRAHYLVLENSFLHDSPNREIDLVDSDMTATPNSNAVLLGNLILKHVLTGNGNVIQFGREKGSRDGILFMYGNTVITKSASPMITLTDSPVAALLSGNVLIGAEQARPNFVGLNNGARLDKITGINNWISPRYTDAVCAPLRLPNMVALPDDFWKEHVLPGGTLDVGYTDGKGVAHRVQTPLGYDGKARWK